MYYWVLLFLGSRAEKSKRIMRKEKEIVPKLLSPPPPPPPITTTKTKPQNPIAAKEQLKFKKESKRGKKGTKCKRRYIL